LKLEGKNVACRNMSWFVDRQVRTVLLPFATVPELEKYAGAQGLDGILVWEHENVIELGVIPYESYEVMDEAFRASSFFESPQVSGGWRWYSVRNAGGTRDLSRP